MLRIMVVVGFLFALIGGASAGPWQGAASAVPAGQSQMQIQKVACGHPDAFCPAGRYRACAPNGNCWCSRCGARYWNDPYYNHQPSPPGLILNFGGGGGSSGADNRRYYPPVNGRCQRGWTIQDGLCKPYRGY